MSAIINSISLGIGTVSLRTDGLTENRFVRDQPYEITPEILTKLNEAIKILADGKKVGHLSVPGLYGTITSEAKKVSFFAKSDNITAIGLVIQSLSQRLMANFFFKLNKPQYPVKFFKTEEEAIEWLHSELEK